ncbi:MAG: SapC family protein [Colwellia sp.]|nr:SapC family protein [Colwellia sp.]
MANVVPVRKDQHKNLKVASTRTLKHVKDQHIAPITAREFARAATSYPIVIIKDQDRYRSVVMLGIEAGENLYYSQDDWQAVYVPQSISMIPFSLGIDPEKEKTLTTCIDLDSEYVGEDKDNALFDAEGNDTEFYKTAQESLGRVYDNEIMTEKFIKELEANNLIQELELNVAFASGENKRLVGLFGINEKTLQELSDDKVLDFHKRGLFVPIYSMMGSVAQVNRLAQLRNKSENSNKVANIQIRPIKVEETAEV